MARRCKSPPSVLIAMIKVFTTVYYVDTTNEGVQIAGAGVLSGVELASEVSALSMVSVLLSLRFHNRTLPFL